MNNGYMPTCGYTRNYSHAWFHRALALELLRVDADHAANLAVPQAFRLAPIPNCIWHDAKAFRRLFCSQKTGASTSTHRREGGANRGQERYLVVGVQLLGNVGLPGFPFPGGHVKDTQVHRQPLRKRWLLQEF